MTCRQQTYDYRTRVIISRGLYFFYPFFTAAYTAERPLFLDSFFPKSVSSTSRLLQRWEYIDIWYMYLPYADHYKPRLVFFYPIFHCGLYCRAFYISISLFDKMFSLFHKFHISAWFTSTLNKHQILKFLCINHDFNNKIALYTVKKKCL